MQPRKVHIKNINGKPIFNRLLDRPGKNVMLFDSPGGFVTKDLCSSERWTICAGWFSDAAWEAMKDG